MFIITETLSIIKWVELIGRKKFITVTLSPNKGIFIIYVTTFSSDLDIYLFHRAQLTSLLINIVFIVVLSKYADFETFFFWNLHPNFLNIPESTII